MKMKTSNTSVETDPVKNAAADKVIAIIEDYMIKEPDGMYFDIPKKLLEDAGKALANRFYFAVGDEGSVAVTPIKYFEHKGCMCEDFEPWPINHLIPNCITTQEPYRDIANAALRTPLDVAKYMQQLGFVWNRECQNEVAAELTKELEVLEQAIVKKHKPSNPGM